MAAARAVLSEKGFEDTLMAEIADRAGVVEGNLYRYFKNRQDLLVKVIEHWYEEMLARDEADFSAIRGAWNQIRFLVHHHLMTIRREPALSRLVFQELRPRGDYRQSRVFHLNQSYTHRLLEIVKDAAARGEFRKDVPASLVRDMIYGCIEHRTWAFLRNEGDFEADSTADLITDIVYRGLASPTRQETLAGAALSRLEAVAARLERTPSKRKAKRGDRR